MDRHEEPPLEVIVLRGVAGCMAAVMSSGEWVGFYVGDTRTAATAQAVLAITERQPD